MTVRVEPRPPVDTAGASRLLGVPARTLEHWRYRGEGPPFYRLGGLIRYKPDELDEWVNARISA